MKKTDQQVLKKFGENVRKIRKMHGWTQPKLGARAGLAANFIGFVERAERSITLKNIVRIQKGLGCSMNKLFEGI